MLLKTTAIGRLGHKPTERRTQGGKSFVTLSLATTHYRGKERGDETVWVDVTIFNENRGKYLMDYAKKGMMLYVEGEPSARAYEDKAGNARANLQLTVGQFEGDVKLLTSKKEAEQMGLTDGEPETGEPPFDPDSNLAERLAAIDPDDDINNLPGW